MNLLDIDLAAVKFINQFFSIPLGYFFIFVIYSVYILLIFFAYFFYRTKQNTKLFHIFFASVIGYIFVASLKLLFANTSLGGLLLARPGNLRPYSVDSAIHVIFEKADAAFPSSHAFIAFLAFYFLPKRFYKFRYFFAIYLLFLIPFALLYTGIHFPSDIIAGAVIGIIIPRLLSERLTSKLANIFKIFK